MDARELARLMLGYDHGPQVQETQTAFRCELVSRWGIEPGMRVLEIGCGQGETTVALAQAVGSDGHVTAVDPASSDYGSPVTVWASADHLRQGPLGSRIDFQFGWDGSAVSDRPFGSVVFPHCSWYFESARLLRDQLAAAREWAARLCFSEWDLTPRSLSQVPHHLAVLAQAQMGIEAGNIRTPLSRARAAGLITDAGWRIVADESVDSRGLQDGGWEVAVCLTDTRPAGLSDFAVSQLDVIREMAGGGKIESLDSFTVVAV